jgi:rhamnosyltransferase
MKKLSVIIPVKNGAATLEACLKSISCQTIASNIELIILDSGSTDNSLQIAGKYGARIIPVIAATFNHGLTRNMGVEQAHSELIYFTVQDARLPDPRMLEDMIKHFEDKEVMAVSGHQAIPAEKDKNPALWFQRSSVPLAVDKRASLPASFKDLSPKQQWEYCSWDNVNAMYRKSALIALPFDDTMHTEDWIWARKALINNLKIIYDSSLVVYHYHHKFFKYTFSNEYIVSAAFYHFFDKRVPSLQFSPKRLITYTYRIWKNNTLKLKDRLYWTYYNLSSEVAILTSVGTFRLLSLFGDKGIRWGNKVFCNNVPIGSQRKAL